MQKDSMFAESFWKLISKNYHFDDEGYETFDLQLDNISVFLRVQEGQLCTSTHQLELLQTIITLDERGVILYNQYGQMTIQGGALQQFYETINKQCMHIDILNQYVFEKVTHNLPNFEIIQATCKMSAVTKSIKKYSKQKGPEYLKKVVTQSKYDYLFEDDENLFIVIPCLNGSLINDLSFEQCSFGLLKMLHKYHSSGFLLTQFEATNVVLLDDNYNMEILDNYMIKRMSHEYQKEVQQDVQIILSYLLNKFPTEQSLMKDVTSVQELLFNEIFVKYFGESEFYRLLNSQPHQSIKQIVKSDGNIIDTFNTIKSLMMDSSDESDDIVPQMQSFNFCSQQFDDSPMLSPKFESKHKSRLSSRQVVLETLLQEHIITEQQFHQFYKEEDFKDQEEINQFSEMLTKEIENSTFTTPIQSDNNTTCPNTVIIHSKKNVVTRISDIIQEAQQEMILSETSFLQSQKPYNVNKVQNVRRNLFNLH